MSTSDLNKIAARMREQRAAEEAERQERARVKEEARQAETWSRKQEQQVLAFDRGGRRVLPPSTVATPPLSRSNQTA